MPETLTPEEAAAEQSEAPALTLSPVSKPALPNPVFDDSSIKAMAAKFRDELRGTKSPAEKPPEPTKEKPAPAAEKPDPIAPAKPEDKPNPDQLPSSKPTNRANFQALEQARDAFKSQAEKAKRELEETRARLTAIETEFTGLKKTLPTTPDEVQRALTERETLAKEKADLIARLETVSLEHSPQFQAGYRAELDKHLKVAEEAMARLEPAERSKALKLIEDDPTDAALDEIVEKLPNSMKRLVDGALAGITAAKIQRKEALAKGPEIWKAIKEREANQARERAASESAKRQKLIDTAVERARGFDAFKPRDNDADHNAKIAEREALVTAIVRGEIDEETMVNVPAAAVEYIYLKNDVIPKLESRLKEQETLIKQLQQASPSPGGGRAATPASEPEDGSGTSFMKSVMKNWTPKK